MAGLIIPGARAGSGGPRTTGGDPPAARPAAGAIPSPNIWQRPGTYELLNRASERDGRLRAAVAAEARRLLPALGTGRVVDVGCGTGFDLVWWSGLASRVTGVEPHPGLARLARERLHRAHLPHEVLDAGAAATGLPSGSVDLVTARWAYFFGPGCEPGLVEAQRVLRPGGHLLIIDVDLTAAGGPRPCYADWLLASAPDVDPAAVEAFWAARGARRYAVAAGWRFGNPDDLRAVLGGEFRRSVAEAAAASLHGGLTVPVPQVIRVLPRTPAVVSHPARTLPA